MEKAYYMGHRCSQEYRKDGSPYVALWVYIARPIRDNGKGFYGNREYYRGSESDLSSLSIGSSVQLEYGRYGLDRVSAC